MQDQLKYTQFLSVSTLKASVLATTFVMASDVSASWNPLLIPDSCFCRESPRLIIPVNDADDSYAGNQTIRLNRIVGDVVLKETFFSNERGSFDSINHSFLWSGFVVKEDRSIDLKFIKDVPIPASSWLFLSGLIGLAVVAKRRHISS